MDNRIEKIRAEVDRLHSKWMLIATTEGYYKCKLCNQLLKFIDSLQEEPVSEDLKHELVQWWDNHYAGIDKSYTFEKFVGHYIENSTLLDIVRHFANWQKQQMMKDAVDACVIDTKGNYPSLAYGHIDMMFALKDMKVVEGDKVKLIIIKED